MSLTFEALSQRRTLRRAPSEEPAEPPPVAIPFPNLPPVIELTPPSSIPLVPISEDDIPGDNPNVPYCEVGEKRPAPAPVAGPKLVPMPTPAVVQPNIGGSLRFALLPEPETSPNKIPSLPEFLVTHHQPKHPLTKQYQELQKGIAQQLTSQQPSVLLFLPLMPEEKSAELILNLAVTRTRETQGRVLVVETNRRNHSSGELLGIPRVPGLRELLAKSVPLGMALHRSAIDSLYLLPAGMMELEADAWQRLPHLLDQLRTRFDWILVEGPSATDGTFLPWVKPSHSIFLLLTEKQWDSPAIDSTRDLIATQGGHLRGCITLGS